MLDVALLAILGADEGVLRVGDGGHQQDRNDQQGRDQDLLHERISFFSGLVPSRVLRRGKSIISNRAGTLLYREPTLSGGGFAVSNEIV
jgi:hypothetical protein